MTTAIAYMFVLGATASMLLAWFDSTLPLHVFHMLRRLRVVRMCPEFWEKAGEWNSTWDDWALAMALYANPFMSELLTCPVCLSFHLSFWIALATILATGASWWLLPFCVFTCPLPANLLRKFYNY